MNVLFIVLNKTELLDDILDAFVEIGIKGATILDSQGMGSAITNSGRGLDPFFGGIRGLLENAKPYNKTIFTLIKGEYLLQQAISIVKDIVVDIDKPGVGLMFTLPVGQVHGIN